MIRCRECGAPQVEGTLFCEECGAYLQEFSATDTVILPFSEFAHTAPPPPLADHQLASAEESITITFVIPNSRRRIRLELDEQLFIGRVDVETDYYPDLNLADDAGAELGVSRRHAVIQVSKNGVVIVDLGSTNGTLLNNSPLSSEIPYPLKSGDELQFGDLLVHIFF